MGSTSLDPLLHSLFSQCCEQEAGQLIVDHDFCEQELRWKAALIFDKLCDAVDIDDSLDNCRKIEDLLIRYGRKCLQEVLKVESIHAAILLCSIIHSVLSLHSIVAQSHLSDAFKEFLDELLMVRWPVGLLPMLLESLAAELETINDDEHLRLLKLQLTTVSNTSKEGMLASLNVTASLSSHGNLDSSDLASLAMPFLIQTRPILQVGGPAAIQSQGLREKVAMHYLNVSSDRGVDASQLTEALQALLPVAPCVPALNREMSDEGDSAALHLLLTLMEADENADFIFSSQRDVFGLAKLLCHGWYRLIHSHETSAVGQHELSEKLNRAHGNMQRVAPEAALTVTDYIIAQLKSILRTWTSSAGLPRPVMACLVAAVVLHLTINPSPFMFPHVIYTLGYMDTSFQELVLEQILDQLSKNRSTMLEELLCALHPGSLLVLPWLSHPQQLIYFAGFKLPNAVVDLAPALLFLQDQGKGISREVVNRLTHHIFAILQPLMAPKVDPLLYRNAHGRRWTISALFANSELFAEALGDGARRVVAENWPVCLQLLATLLCAAEKGKNTAWYDATVQCAKRITEQGKSAQEQCMATSSWEEVLQATVDILVPSPLTASSLRQSDDVMATIALMYSNAVAIQRVLLLACRSCDRCSSAVCPDCHILRVSMSCCLDAQTICIWAARKVTRHAVASAAAVEPMCGLSIHDESLPSKNVLENATSDEANSPSQGSVEEYMNSALPLGDALAFLGMQLSHNSTPADPRHILSGSFDLAQMVESWCNLAVKTDSELQLASVAGACREVIRSLLHATRGNTANVLVRPLIKQYHTGGYMGIEGGELLLRFIQIYVRMFSRQAEDRLRAQSKHKRTCGAFQWLDAVPPQDGDDVLTDVSASAGVDDNEDYLLAAFSSGRTTIRESSLSWKVTSDVSRVVESRVEAAKALQHNLLECMMVNLPSAASVRATASSTSLADLFAQARCEWLQMIHFCSQWNNIICSADDGSTSLVDATVEALNMVSEELFAGLTKGLTRREVMESLQVLSTLIENSTTLPLEVPLTVGLRLMRCLRLLGKPDSAIILDVSALILNCGASAVAAIEGRRGRSAGAYLLSRWVHFIVDCIILSKLSNPATNMDVDASANSDDEMDEKAYETEKPFSFTLGSSLDESQLVQEFLQPMPPVGGVSDWIDHESAISRDLAAVQRRLIDFGCSPIADHLLAQVFGQVIACTPAAGEIASTEVQTIVAALFLVDDASQIPLWQLLEPRKLADVVASISRFINFLIKDCSVLVGRARGNRRDIPVPPELDTSLDGALEGQGSGRFITSAIKDASFALSLMHARGLIVNVGPGTISSLRRRLTTLNGLVDRLAVRLKQTAGIIRRRGWTVVASSKQLTPDRREDYASTWNDFATAAELFAASIMPDDIFVKSPQKATVSPTRSPPRRKRRRAQSVIPPGCRNRNSVIDAWLTEDAALEDEEADGLAEDTFADIEDFVVPDDADVD